MKQHLCLSVCVISTCTAQHCTRRTRCVMEAALAALRACDASSPRVVEVTCHPKPGDSVPLVPFMAADIEHPRFTSTTHKALWSLLPLPSSYDHAKRIRRLPGKTSSDGTRSLPRLTLLLCPQEEYARNPTAVLNKLAELHLQEPFVAQVRPRYCAVVLCLQPANHVRPSGDGFSQVPSSCGASREQSLELSKVWPVHFRKETEPPPPPTADETRQMATYMAEAVREALQAKQRGCRAVGCVMVDPSSGAIIARSGDFRRASESGAVKLDGSTTTHLRSCAVTPKVLRLGHACMECIHATASVVRSWKVATTARRRRDDGDAGTDASGSATIGAGDGAGDGAGAGAPAVVSGGGVKRKREGAPDAAAAAAGAGGAANPDQYVCTGYDLYTTHEVCPMYVVHTLVVASCTACAGRADCVGSPGVRWRWFIRESGGWSMLCRTRSVVPWAHA